MRRPHHRSQRSPTSHKESTPHNGHNAGVTVERTRLIELEVRRFANVLPSKPRLSDTSGPDGLSHRPGFFYGIGQLPHMIAIEKGLNLTWQGSTN